jgi:hypothetical protein
MGQGATVENRYAATGMECKPAQLMVRVLVRAFSPACSRPSGGRAGAVAKKGG